MTVKNHSYVIGFCRIKALLVSLFQNPLFSFPVPFSVL